MLTARHFLLKIPYTNLHSTDTEKKIAGYSQESHIIRNIRLFLEKLTFFHLYEIPKTTHEEEGNKEE